MSLLLVQSRDILAAAKRVSGGSGLLPKGRQTPSVDVPSSRASHPGIDLSGGVTPRESMPEFVQNIMLGAPTTHFTALAQGILYRGAGFDIVWPQLAAIVGLGLVFFGIALLRFRASLAAQS